MQKESNTLHIVKKNGDTIKMFAIKTENKTIDTIRISSNDEKAIIKTEVYFVYSTTIKTLIVDDNVLLCVSEGFIESNNIENIIGKIVIDIKNKSSYEC